MRKTIILEEQALQYELRTSTRAKRVSLTVRRDGAVILTAPFYVPPVLAEQFLRRHSSWLFKKVSSFNRRGSMKPQSLPRGSLHAYKDEARLLVENKLLHFNQIYGFSYVRVTIRDQRTRWGSCSARGTMSFNFRLVYLPSRLADYVIIHELCHLAHLDHSKDFWSLVERACPDYGARRRELRALAFS